MANLIINLVTIGDMVDHIRAEYNDRGSLHTIDDFDHSQVLMLAEEAGEFVAAYRRYMGWARRAGTHEDMIAELADIVIAACAVADSLDIDINEAVNRKLDRIFARGWSE